MLIDEATDHHLVIDGLIKPRFLVNGGADLGSRADRVTFVKRADVASATSSGAITNLDRR